MTLLRTLTLPLAALALVGCNADRVYVTDPPPASGYDFVPELRSFEIIDSYGYSSRLDPGEPLILDPYHDAGLFEIDWQVDSLEDYQASFRVGRRSNIAQSTVVYTEICGEGLPCDQGALRLCQYYPDLYMACGLDDTEVDVSSQIQVLPQRLYAFIEICDLNSDYCEYDYIRVWAE